MAEVDPVAARGLHDAALTRAAALVDGTGDDAWDRPTPCAGWTVRQVVEHLAWGNTVLTAALRGGAYREPAGGRLVPLPPPVPLAYRATVTTVRELLTHPGVLDRPLHFPAGPLPAADALLVRVQDVVVHCWDLAAATGRRETVLDRNLVAAALRVAEARRSVGALAPEQFAPARRPRSESTLGRLLAAVGRDERWVPPPGGLTPGA